MAFGCNDGKTIVVFGGNVDIEVRPHATPVCTNATWALDVASGRWTRAAESSVERPSPRCFNADGAGGGVLRDAADTEWLVVFGGLCQPGYRDNQTWILGPLGDAPERWQWWEVQADGETHSEDRPTARFHHAMLVASLPSPRIIGSERSSSNWSCWAATTSASSRSGTLAHSHSRTCGCSPSPHGTSADSGHRASFSD